MVTFETMARKVLWPFFLLQYSVHGICDFARRLIALLNIYALPLHMLLVYSPSLAGVTLDFMALEGVVLDQTLRSLWHFILGVFRVFTRSALMTERYPIHTGEFNSKLINGCQQMHKLSHLG